MLLKLPFGQVTHVFEPLGRLFEVAGFREKPIDPRVDSADVFINRSVETLLNLG